MVFIDIMSACHASVTFPFQTEDQSSEDMDSLDDDSVVDNADTNINVSTNPCNCLLLIHSHLSICHSFQSLTQLYCLQVDSSLLIIKYFSLMTFFF